MDESDLEPKGSAGALSPPRMSNHGKLFEDTEGDQQSQHEPEKQSKKSDVVSDHKPPKESESKLSKESDHKPPKESESKLSKESDHKPPKESESKLSKESDKAPIGPTLDLGSVIAETTDILDTYRRCLSERKTKQAMASYYLQKLGSTLDDYAKFQKKLDNFFSQHDIVTAEIYRQHCIRSPEYGDYKKIIKDSPKTVKYSNTSLAIPEGETRKLVIATSDNFFAGGKYTRGQYAICKNIDSLVAERRLTCNRVKESFPLWVEVLEREANNNQKQSDDMFEIQSYIQFLITGIDEEPLNLTLPTYGNIPPAE